LGERESTATMKTKPTFEELPEWAMVDDGDGRVFVIRLHWPRFISECKDRGDGVVVLDALFFDDESKVIATELAAGREPAQTVARLMREAADYCGKRLFDDECE
jgi:hypothetical protein